MVADQFHMIDQICRTVFLLVVNSPMIV